MDLYEYQARELFHKHGVPVVMGKVVETPAQAQAVAAEFGGMCVVKAQVKTGGRGKAGGVKLARTPAQAHQHAADILGMDIKGHTVHRVLVVPALDIVAEYYFSILLDRSNRRQLAMCAREGGMDIEQLAAEHPDQLVKYPLAADLDIEAAHQILQQAGFSSDEAAKIAPVLRQLGEVYVAEDALLVEVNPLVMTANGQVFALDGKVTLDDNAAFRHPEHSALVDQQTQDPLEAKAKERGLNYVSLDGQVGVIGNGAGLVMSTLDVVAYAGEEYGVSPANFLDIGGGASAQVMADGLDIILSNPAVRSVFVNVFGGITACEEVASGILQALDILGPKATKPIVVRLDGNGFEEGRRILAAANHPLVTLVPTMDGGAAKAAQLAQSN